ncbi:unnamed protein product [Closterium sp. NIES-54]
MALCPSSLPLRVPLLPPPESSRLAVHDPQCDCARAASPTVSRLLATVVTDPTFQFIAASALVAELVDFAAACRLDYATSLVAESESTSSPSVGDIPTPRSYAEAILGPYSAHWQAAMDAEMASWKSTGTYVDVVSPSRANIVNCMWIFRVKRPPGSPPAFKARYVARGFRLRQGVDYFQTFSPSPKITTLWWHDTLRTTLAALGYTPSTADPLLFLLTDTSLPLFYVLVYLVFATAATEPLTLVKSELQKRHTCTDLGELHSYLGLHITRDTARCTITLTQSHMVHQVLQHFGFQFSSPQPTPLSTGHSLSAPASNESVEPSVPFPELVGCLMYMMTCTRPDLAYHLSLLARYVAPDASWVDGSATQWSSQGYTFSLGSGSVSLQSTRSSSVLSSNCEAEIYAGAMAAQELRWLTYLLTDLGKQPCSPPGLMKRLSEEKQKRIMQRIAEGRSYRQIAQELGVSKSAVHDELLRHLGPNTFDELVPSPAKPGRPPKLPEQIARIVIRSIVSGESKSAEAAAGMISSTHGISVTGATVRNTLKRHRVRAIEKPSKPRLSAKNVKDRRQWAKDHQHWTIDDWKRVVWSDETKICWFSSDGRSWAWIREDCHMEPHHVKQTVKHGGGSIMIWGCMTYNGGGFMCKIEGRMNGELYRSILQDELQQTIEHYELDPETIVFQHDNDPKHTCKMVKTYLAEQPYSVLPWPASSPDLNPIEHLWV